MQGYCDVYKWTILKRTSPEVKCLHLTSSRRETCTPSVSNVIYHKFSHGAAFCALNGKNVNVMLELDFNSERLDVQTDRFEQFRYPRIHFQACLRMGKQTRVLGNMLYLQK